MTRFAQAIAFVLLLASSPQLFAQRELIQIDEKRAELHWQQEIETQKKLDQIIDVEFENTMLGDAFGQLEKRFGIEYSIDRFNVERHFGTEPRKPFSVEIKDLPLRAGLDRILQSDTRELEWWIDGHLVMVSVDEIASEQMTSRVYDVSNVLKRSSEPVPLVPGGGFSSLQPTVRDQHENSRLTSQEVLATTQPVDANVERKPEASLNRANIDHRFKTVHKTPNSQKERSAREPAFFPVQFLAEQEDIEDQDADNSADDSHANDDRYYDFGPIIETIEIHTGRETWSSLGGNGELTQFVAGGKPLLVIKQSRKVHEEIAALLLQIEQTAGLR